MHLLNCAIVFFLSFTIFAFGLTPNAKDDIIGVGSPIGNEKLQAEYESLVNRSSNDLLEYADKDPKSEMADEAIYCAAEEHAAKGNYSKAIELTDLIIKNYPHSAYLERLVPLGLASGVIPIPERKIHEHLRSHPNFSADMALLLKADCLEKLGRVKDANRILREYVDSHPTGRHSKEDARFRASNALKPHRLSRTDEQISLVLAKRYISGEEYNNAKKVLLSALEVFQHSHEEWRFARLLAQSYNKTGDMKAEEKTLERLKSLFESGNVPRRLSSSAKNGQINTYDDVSDDITMPEVEKRIKELRGEKESSPQSTPPQQKQ